MIGDVINDYGLYMKHSKLDRSGSESISACVFHLISIVHPSGFVNRIMVEGEVYVNGGKIIYADASGLKHLILTGSGVVYIDELLPDDAEEILARPELYEGVSAVFKK